MFPVCLNGRSQRDGHDETQKREQKPRRFFAMHVWCDPSKQLRDRKRLNVTYKEAVAKAQAVFERWAAAARWTTMPARPVPAPSLSTPPFMGSTAEESCIAPASDSLASLPAELKTLVAEKLDVRSLGSFATASAECQSAAYDELRAALIVAVRKSLAPVSGRLPWGQRAIKVALVSDALVACPYFRLPDELVASPCRNQAMWQARAARAAAWPRLDGAWFSLRSDLALKAT